MIFIERINQPNQVHPLGVEMNKTGKKIVYGLGIESTAHTFGASVVDSTGRILTDAKSVYIPPQGSGIHPREASRHHSEKAANVIDEALRGAGIKARDLSFIAYSAGPGLGPCLRVGATVARAIASYFNLPLIPVNHAVGHIEIAALEAGFLDPLVLLVSGGHTLISAHSYGRWRIFGETLDITIGQLLDQFGRAAGFASPAGRKLEELAKAAERYISLPYTVKGNDVSFSGILTAAKNMLASGESLEDLAYSLQETGFAMLCEVTERALAFTEKSELLVAGGVAANRRLCEMLNAVALRHNAKFCAVSSRFAGDCGAQIAWAGLLAFSTGVFIPLEKSVIRQSWRLDSVDTPWRS
ncbi:MAG: KEOPS complex N(6)-L-threonylcarbamoyladenine synthase Kae1 [Nitrososphaerales archaeon]